MLLISVGLIKKTDFKPDDEIFKTIEKVFVNCMHYDNILLNRISAEGLVIFYKPFLQKDQEFVMGVISDLE